MRLIVEGVASLAGRFLLHETGPRALNYLRRMLETATPGNGQGVSVRSVGVCRPLARFANLDCERDRFWRDPDQRGIDVLTRELALLLCAWPGLVTFDRHATIRARDGEPDARRSSRCACSACAT